MNHFFWKNLPLRIVESGYEWIELDNGHLVGPAFMGVSGAGQVTLFVIRIVEFRVPRLCCWLCCQLPCSKEEVGSTVSRSLLAEGLWWKVKSRLIRLRNRPGSLESPNTKSTFSGVLPFEEGLGLLFCGNFWLLSCRLAFAVLLRDDLCHVPMLLKEHFLGVIISFQIERDLDMSEFFPPGPFPTRSLGRLRACARDRAVN